ncbi:phenazine biosynthesis FMN-dependent oxidase PhzG [Micromonospora sp. WMMA1923]|uniref:phenazine biosynthesis FMN-dependent oxidase PhzG n=1 Tax=Micromonospora sp. WMMA1923 TaxID=3404125 RepID=UPI003B93D851
MSTSAQQLGGNVFATPPDEPMGLLRSWLDAARADAVREPGALALATADADGRPSTRMVQVLAVRDTGLLFASHSGSRKGRELAANRWASGVLYWREVARQVVVSGPTGPLGADEADALWMARPVATHPMSVASQQSAPLTDENALREQARQLGDGGVPLPRPDAWLAYLLEPESVEFWESSPDRLHRRLRFDRDGTGWRSDRLQP